MIGAEKTAEMLTTIFGGETSLGVSLPSRFPGEERVLSIISFPPPPSFADIGLKSLLSHCCYYGEWGGGEGAARNVIPSSLPMDIPCCRYSKPSFALSTGIAREESDLTDEQRKEKLK